MSLLWMFLVRAAVRGQHIGPVLRVARRRKQIALLLSHRWQNGTRCMPESLGAPGLRKRTPPTRSLFASFAGCRQDNSAEAGDTCIRLERWACWLSGPARSRGGGGPSEKRRPSLASLR